MVDVDLHELDMYEERCCYRPPQSGCSDEFTQLVEIIPTESYDGNKFTISSSHT